MDESLKAEIQIIVDQTGAFWDISEEALKAASGDIVEAILRIDEGLYDTNSFKGLQNISQVEKDNH